MQGGERMPVFACTQVSGPSDATKAERASISNSKADTLVSRRRIEAKVNSLHALVCVEMHLSPIDIGGRFENDTLVHFYGLPRSSERRNTPAISLPPCAVPICTTTPRQRTKVP